MNQIFTESACFGDQACWKKRRSRGGVWQKSYAGGPSCIFDILFLAWVRPFQNNKSKNSHGGCKETSITTLRPWPLMASSIEETVRSHKAKGDVPNQNSQHLLWGCKAVGKGFSSRKVLKNRNFVPKKWHFQNIHVFYLVVSTQLKNISQNGNLPQVGMEIKKKLKPPPSFFLCQVTVASKCFSMITGVFCAAENTNETLVAAQWREEAEPADVFQDSENEMSTCQDGWSTLPSLKLT